MRGGGYQRDQRSGVWCLASGVWVIVLDMTGGLVGCTLQVARCGEFFIIPPRGSVLVLFAIVLDMTGGLVGCTLQVAGCTLSVGVPFSFGTFGGLSASITTFSSLDSCSFVGTLVGSSFRVSFRDGSRGGSTLSLVPGAPFGSDILLPAKAVVVLSVVLIFMGSLLVFVFVLLWVCNRVVF